MAHELEVQKELHLSFPKLMSLYSSNPRSRKDLLLAIKKRIEYVKTFPQLYNRTTEFHRELSTIPHLNEIFTTNWDDFFELECNATPIVTSEDYAVVQDTPGRKVFKLHGSIYNYGSIVATEEDYRRCYRRLSKDIIGSALRVLLMSKTLVFFGFSFKDEDFRRIYHLLKKEVGGMIPRSYVVTLNEKAKENLDVLGINAAPIITSATFFIKRLKQKLVEEKLMLPDEKYDGIDEALDKVCIEHYRLSKISLAKHPDAIYSLFYQDGLIHSFERLIATKKSGENSCGMHVIDVIEAYDKTIKEHLHKRNYTEVAYFTGYKAGLLYFLLEEEGRKSLPFYFLFGCDDILDYHEYKKLEKEASRLHKSAHKLAEKIASRASGDLVPHHLPFG